MSFFIPCSEGFEDDVKNPQITRYWKLLIDIDDDDVLEDVTYLLDNNEISGGGKLSGANNESIANSYHIKLKNSDDSLKEGDFSRAMAALECKVGANEYIRVFTGFVSDEGCSRKIKRLNINEVEITLVDSTKIAAINRKCDPVYLINYTISDPDNTDESIFHQLAYMLGLNDGDLDIGAKINYTLTVLGFEKKDSVWKEMQKLASAYLGVLTFRYDGKLRFFSRFETGYIEQESEWTFDEDNFWDFEAAAGDILCNRVKTEFNVLTNLSSRVVHLNTGGYDVDTNQISIEIAAGEYWPGPGANDIAVLEFTDPTSGEKWDTATDRITPTIGATGAGKDIECSGGTITLESFDGVAGTNPDKTEREYKGSQIILKNTTGSTITLTRFQLRGNPVRIEKKITCEAIDTNIVNEWEYIDKEIDGRYMSGETQAHATVKWWEEQGENQRKTWKGKTYWNPLIQEGAIVELDYPTFGINNKYAQVIEFKHKTSGSPAKWTTSLTLREWDDYTPSGTPKKTVRPISGSSTEHMQNVPTTTDLQDGYTTGGGVIVPTAPVIAEIRGEFKAIILRWDIQLNLTNLDHYEIQVSDDDITWYALKMDGTDWKGQQDAVTECSVPYIIHLNIPFAGSSELPTGRTLYYRVRRQTKAGVNSDWSASASATTAALVTGDLAGYQVTAYKMDGYSRSQHGVFLEIFEILPSSWITYDGSGTETIQDSVGQCGGKAYQVAGYIRKAFQSNIPYDPSKTYRLRCRVRRTATSDAAKQYFFMSIMGIAADGITLVNINGDNSYLNQHHIAASNEDGSAWTLNEWQLFTGWFSGWAATGSGKSADPTDPGQLHEDVRYFRPYIIMNYNGGPVGNVIQLDYIAIDVFDEDELYRSYAGINVDGTIAANKVVANSILANAVETDKIATNAVTATKILAGTIDTNHLAVGLLNAMIALISDHMIIDSSLGYVTKTYSGSPTTGDIRCCLFENKLYFERWSGSAWVTYLQLDYNKINMKCGLIVGGFGAMSTGGTLDWNDVSNAVSGNGYTLLYGDAANGPGPHVYFHAFCFEFTTKDGTGNMTQFAIPYSTSSLAYGIYMRTRTSSVWTNWCHVISTDVDGNIQGNLVLTGTLTMPLKTSIHSTNVTENTIYDTIVPFIPNINDEILMSGSIYYAATQLLYIISKAKKTAASIITVYGILFHPDDLSVETASIQMTNGGAIVYNNVSIAI